jgi:hypothetical protein
MVEQLKRIFNKYVIIGGLVLTMLMCGFVWFLQMSVFPYVEISNGQKAIVIVTPYEEDGINSEISGLEPTDTVPAESLPGVVALGMKVKVTGTGDEGLRMRSNAGMDQTVMFLANEGETFTIVDGPIIKDSMIWWKIQGNEDNRKIGWSVQDFLEAVQ